MSSFNPGWYVLYTRPNRERAIASHLERRAMDFYLPTIRVCKKWSDRKKVVESPLFSSYIFVNLHSSSDYFTSLEIPGTIEYIRFGKQLAGVSESVVKSLRIVVDSKKELLLCRENIATGEPLHITDGPLSGLECEMVQYHGRDKILVRVTLLSRVILVDMPVGSLTRAADTCY
ncbi:transcription termination/antitermination protein NusG [Chitinophaga sp. HK235]|uniref:transcription termination/antitermination protein NusG n=1 Tax=Chitinophaga sp. HK235 TaxID=2952571 RepID=UPI001BA6B8EC|nr:UpxY family transcription antiterminator [Chitinophaga sp. HK235]